MWEKEGLRQVDSTKEPQIFSSMCNMKPETMQKSLIRKIDNTTILVIILKSVFFFLFGHKMVLVVAAVVVVVAPAVAAAAAVSCCSGELMDYCLFFGWHFLPFLLFYIILLSAMDGGHRLLTYFDSTFSKGVRFIELLSFLI